MGRKKKRKDKGALEYVSVKNRKKVKALIRCVFAVKKGPGRITEKGST